MLTKHMKCTENCNACSQHWSTERVQFFTTMPNCTSHNQCFRSWTNWTKMFCLIHHFYLNSCQLTTSSSNISKTFCRENGFHNQQEAKNAFQEAVESQSMEFYAAGINNLISHWQKCVDCINVLILINKDAFEPSYNDLKSTVWNHDYICTNLITNSMKTLKMVHIKKKKKS